MGQREVPFVNVTFDSKADPGLAESQRIAHSHAARSAHARVRRLRMIQYQAQQRAKMRTLKSDRKVTVVIPLMRCNESAVFFTQRMIRLWVPTAITDLSLLNIVLLASCRHLSVGYGQGQQAQQCTFQQLSFQYKSKSLQALRHAISAEMPLLSDSTVAKAIMLAYDENQATSERYHVAPQNFMSVMCDSKTSSAAPEVRLDAGNASDFTGTELGGSMRVDSVIDQSLVVGSEEGSLDPLWWPDLKETTEWLSLTGAIGGASSALPRLERRVLEFWPRINDTNTWAFCIQTFLGYVDNFLNTGTLPLVDSLPDRQGDPPPILRDVYGVCAAYRTCQPGTRPFYLTLLKAGVDNASTSNASHTELQDRLDRLQALILYYILFLAGGVRDQFVFIQVDCMLAQSTADLERTELELRQTSEVMNPHPSQSHWKNRVFCENARRLIMISYLVRAVYAVVHFHRCDFIKYLAGLPVSTPPDTDLSVEGDVGGPNPAQLVSGVVSYDELVSVWEQGGLSQVDEFRFLLLVACKGLDTVQGKILPSM
ncbi:uncharacterized protein BO80DRAFT_505383 [Aspergillus ibericus CBS 121593]|uniref:Transcription factor domain-containing protein n=1 Tax=Aspergillus ibericus CBS 121593 TaxID=1448316 RepID=A0A395GMA2_9EURO|nr:hypothetical protein BO80DRAFT_505383 [Aspergillus ibericus CBS 121593]RAK96472.1 hypothetical protein BO80DRAFT_505383 [Aspergillus ibericus CBS 121593]